MIGTTLVCGCVPVFPPKPAPLFTMPLTVEGEPVGSVIVDTGGAYELMLRDGFGLTITGSIEVLAFGGKELVDITEGFDYSVGGVDTTAETALVGLSVCDCNGLGFDFFRKTGVVLALDFAALQASFLPAAPDDGVVIAFEQAPPALPGFDSAFVDVEVTLGDVSRHLLGLLDTGTNGTLMRRGLFDGARPLTPDRLDVIIGRLDLGAVAVNVALFDTEGLPEIILGTDVMRAWGDRWYFSFESTGGTVTVIPAGGAHDAPDTADALLSAALAVP